MVPNYCQHILKLTSVIYSPSIMVKNIIVVFEQSCAKCCAYRGSMGFEPLIRDGHSCLLLLVLLEFHCCRVYRASF